MSVADGRPHRLRFATFEVDAGSRELFRQGRRVRRQEQPFQLLVALLERPGEVLTREELKQRVWPDDTVVDFDRGLNRAIRSEEHTSELQSPCNLVCRLLLAKTQATPPRPQLATRQDICQAPVSGLKRRSARNVNRRSPHGLVPCGALCFF